MIIYRTDQEHFDKLGGKAGALARLGEKYSIPAWFAVVNDAEDRDEILRAAEELSGTSFAVRSSARSEDGIEHSFAGQYDSYLYVKKDDLIDRIRDVMNSGQSDRLETYRDNKQLENAEKPTAIVQKMISPDVSGVAFSADPISGDRSTVVISANWGTGSSVVSGEADADCWRIRGSEIVVEIARKTHQHSPAPSQNEGVALAEVPEDKQNIPCLSDEQLAKVAELVRSCEKHFGTPQDIEWAIQGNNLYLLQSRPITTLPEGELIVWDNSNIAESYSGITSPLTYSFAKRAYEHVYREFCRILSVPSSRLRRHDRVFPEMLGHIQGHVFYNLNSWYEVLAILPGFSVNRGFMEQMMGVKEPMPEEVVEEILARTKTNPVVDTFAFIKTLIGLLKHDHRIGQTIENFYRRLDEALATRTNAELTSMDRPALIEHYLELEKYLLRKWDAPLINDFLAMIYYGVLRSCCEKWLKDASAANQLLLDCGEIVSAEPPRRIARMAALIKNEADGKTLASQTASRDTKLNILGESDPLLKEYQSYIEKFGDRCLEELKLESPTLGDDPDSLLSSIGAMALRPSQVDEKDDNAAELEVPLHGIRRRVFDYILRKARSRVRDRENLRFERTRLFGRVRRIVIEIGKHLHTEDRIDDPKDVFFLKISEIMSEEVTGGNLRELVSSRKSEEQKFTTPPDRFYTRGPATSDSQLFDVFQSDAPTPEDDHHFCGVAACPGLVRGRVRVVLDPAQACLVPGEILVACQTDPGWVVLFPPASGLLVERGSLLSHSAIVARELALPCIVSIRDVTTRLQTGDFIEMDGRAGTVTILSNAN